MGSIPRSDHRPVRVISPSRVSTDILRYQLELPRRDVHEIIEAHHLRGLRDVPIYVIEDWRESGRYSRRQRIELSHALSTFGLNVVYVTENQLFENAVQDDTKG